ncbi:MAG: hypothetical protein ACOCWQ_05475 [Nanoarchaeota archaeon]
MTKRKLLVLVFLFMLMLFTIRGAGFVQLIAFLFLALRPVMPITLLMPYYVLIGLLPLLAIVLTHNAIAGELETRSVVFVVTNIQRRSYVLGKMGAVMFLHVLVVLISLLLASMYTYYQLRVFYLRETVYLFFLLVLFAAALVFMYGLISALTAKTEKSLQVCVFVTILLVIAAFFPSLQSFSPFWYARSVFSAAVPAIIYWIAVAVTTCAGTIILFERKQI